MDLSDRSGGQRSPVERLKQLLDGLAELSLYHLTNEVKLDGGNLVPTLLALFYQLGWEDTFASTDYLGQLDIGRPQLLSGQPDPL